ncbi:hypothetical protein GCM10027036_03590 [Flavihumibacter cheonanensis]|uniref:hypothetical protein n=1 Tax=Flavihumibacter TaxID=1004301 RepID=UPI001EF8FF28|nr:MULTISPECIES: hypothetical protein [Flavihumibacter]MCG7752197.1 hypothetical protein [Flavihumibacter cheonanensis]
MNEKNLEYLANQLKYTGFGESLQEKLKENISKQVPEFVLYHQAEFGKDSVAATLHFRKSPETDMYFFNRYNVLLKSEQHPDPIKQTFYMANKEDNITFKEGYNLLSGRAVQKTLTNKAGEKAEGWVQLDFKELDKQGNYKLRSFYPSYGYDLGNVLSQVQLKELERPESKEALMESLQRGNRQAVTMEVDGSFKRFFIEAAPQYKQLNWYDERQTRIKTPSFNQSSSQEITTRNEIKKKEESNQKQSSKEEVKPKSTRKGKGLGV